MLERLLAALIFVESGGDCEAVGKAGERGPLQITRAYYEDAKEQVASIFGCHRPVPEYEEAAHSLTWSKLLTTYYFHRYARSRWPPQNMEDCKVLARIHNGGPTGHRKKATLAYWQKVKAEMQK